MTRLALRRMRLFAAVLFTGAFALAAGSGNAQPPDIFYPSRPAPGSPFTLAPGETSPAAVIVLPASGGTAIARIVVESSGAPIAGVLVEAKVGRFSALSVSGGDGRVTIVGVPAGQVSLRTRPADARSPRGDIAARYSPGVVDEEDATRLPLADGATVDFGDLPVPEAGRIKARVAHPSGAPMAGATVVLKQAQGPLRLERAADQNGRVSFGALEPGAYRLWVIARGTDLISEAWDGARDTLSSEPIVVSRGDLIDEIVMTPDPGARISGVVRDQDTNFGLRDLDVHVIPINAPEFPFVFRTDEIGFYVATGLPTGSYRIFVPAIRRYHPDAETEGAARIVQVVEPREVTGRDVRGSLDPDCLLGPNSSGTIEGIVRADFFQMPRARVIVWNDTDTISHTLREEGVYRIGCVRPGHYRARFLPDGVYRTQYHPKTNDPDQAALISVTAGDTAFAIDFQPDFGVAIEAQAVPEADGVGIPGVSVRARLADGIETVARTDAAGFVRLDRLADGSGMPEGTWSVATDSIVVTRIPATAVRGPRLDARIEGEWVVLEFRIPEERAVLSWILLRRSNCGTIVPIADSGTDPEGVAGRRHRDPVPVFPSAYRLAVERRGETGSRFEESEWVEVDADNRRRAAIAPQPWDGTAPLRLADGPVEGGVVEWYGPAGDRVARGRFVGGRVAAEDLRHLPDGVYFARWRDPDGIVRAQRMVLKR